MLIYKHPEGSSLALSQQHHLKEIVSPIWHKRYNEKLTSLHLGEDWLNEADVSLPIAKKQEMGDAPYNTVVFFEFPKTHPILKGRIGVVYERVTFEKYFKDVDLVTPIEVFFEDIKDLSNEEYLTHLRVKFSERLGRYFDFYGNIFFKTGFDFIIDPLKHHFCVEVPTKNEVVFTLDKGFIKQNETMVDVDVRIDYSYIIQSGLFTLPLTFKRRVPVDTTQLNKDNYEARRDTHKPFAHSWYWR